MNRLCLEKFKSAWAAEDYPALAECLHNDIVYYASIGPEPGKSWRGKSQVLSGIKKMIAHDHATAQMGEIYETGNVIFWTWEYFDKTTGAPIAKGCDIFHFKQGLILKKDAYRKVFHD
ncbi:MAG TPA: nuclear transport factor 2 family protein [Hellea balneolensis]|uniref:Nuclear transport factor 2 family protein n=1 Tax=Hellea balneolensis TaxID=287478 RepID=A0A7C5QWI7_9PROT|nr:nuclear transport factor 2 family protein [Hellea balneolensis]